MYPGMYLQLLEAKHNTGLEISGDNFMKQESNNYFSRNWQL